MSATLLAAVPAVLVWTGRSLRESAFMFIETLWPLGLGFTLSGAIQAFTTREQMERALGDHRLPSVLRASGYGMASSSCSYAAAAMAKSLFQRGADFVSSMVFMFASTNLVVELGVVLAVLIGWRFLAAEFVGGAIMIALLALCGALVFSSRELAAARHKLEAASPSTAPEARGGSLRVRLRNPVAWREAAAYAISDLMMVKNELLIGYLVAGALAVAVPDGFWSALFLRGHGSLTVIENAVVGPLIAVASFVCSVGNVPLAAALWKEGISFGGVIAFLFADLITFPLLLIYRRYYGRLVWKMLPLFWAVMSGAGLLTEGLFRLAGIAPTNHTSRLNDVTFAFSWPELLDIVAIAALVALVVVHRHRPQGPQARLATDPICKMQVEKANPGATFTEGDETVYFCSEGCRDHYVAQLTPSHDASPS